MAELSKGDNVTWGTPQGKTSGKITKKITDTQTVSGHTAKASKYDPQFEVKSDSSGKKAIHKPQSLKKK